MKKLIPLVTLIITIGAGILSAQDNGKVIDLKKPVGESIKPDGFYWSFDDGIEGTTDPNLVEDLSGNGYMARLGAEPTSQLPTYALGKFGTCFYVHGFPRIEWNELHKNNDASDNARIDMAGQSFTGGVWYKMEDRKLKTHALIRKDENTKGWRLLLNTTTDGQEGEAGNSWTVNLQVGNSQNRATSQATTEVFADGNWHHVGFSLRRAPGSEDMEVTYYIDGQVLEAVQFSSTMPEAQKRFILVGYGCSGLVDDAFVTSGVHSFKP
jgi:hypothetical protein